MQVGTAVSSSYYDYEREKNSDERTTEIGQEDFLELFITQLKYQDPLSPMDNTEFLAQTAQFTQLEQITAINENIQKMVDGDSAQNAQELLYGASGFIGKAVEYKGDTTTLTDSGAIISFNLSQTPYQTKVIISDDTGKIVAQVEPVIEEDGKVTIGWDGSGVDGSRLDNGIYNVAVKAYDEEGEEIDVTTYASGYVFGVENTGTSLKFNVSGTTVDAEDIISVYAS